MFLSSVILNPLNKNIVASGALITSTYSNSGLTYTVLTYTSSGTLTLSRGGKLEYLLVGGGGGGAGSITATNGGGGGGGQCLHNIGSPISLKPGIYTITIGNGGAGGVGGFDDGSTGTNTTITGQISLTAAGGLGGVWAGGPSTRNGGAAGGGNLGGLNSYVSGPPEKMGGGGGGGAGGAGSNASSGNPGNGGIGALLNITGNNEYYAGGGRGGQWANTTSNNFATNGSGLYGQGGSGGYSQQVTAGNGSAGQKGVVILRFVV